MDVEFVDCVCVCVKNGSSVDGRPVRPQANLRELVTGGVRTEQREERERRGEER